MFNSKYLQADLNQLKEERNYWEQRATDLEAELRRHVESNLDLETSDWNRAKPPNPIIVQRAKENEERRNRVANICFNAHRGRCRLGDYCGYSHDLIPFPYCREYNESGTCPYRNCKLIHALYEYQAPHLLKPEHVEAMKKQMFDFSMTKEPVQRPDYASQSGGYSDREPITEHKRAPRSSRSRSPPPVRSPPRSFPSSRPVAPSVPSAPYRRDDYSWDGYGDRPQSQDHRWQTDRAPTYTNRAVDFNYPNSSARDGGAFPAAPPQQQGYAGYHAAGNRARSRSGSRGRGGPAPASAPVPARQAAYSVPPPPPAAPQATPTATGASSAQNNAGTDGGEVGVGGKRKKHYLL